MAKFFQNIENLKTKKTFPVEDHLKNWESYEERNNQLRKNFPEKQKENFDKCFIVEDLMKRKKRVPKPERVYKGNFIMETINNVEVNKKNRKQQDDPNKFIFPIVEVKKDRILWKDRKKMIEDEENKIIVDSIEQWEKEKLKKKEIPVLKDEKNLKTLKNKNLKKK